MKPSTPLVMMDTYLGVDVAQAQSQLHLIGPDRRTRYTGALPASHQAFEACLTDLSERGVDPERCHVLMEATGWKHLCFADAFVRAGFRVYVLNALYVARRRGPGNAIRENKTDPVDAAGLAHLGLDDGATLERFRYRPDAQVAGRHKLVSVREQLMKQRINAIKSAQGLLEGLFPEAAEVGLELVGPRARACLRKYPLPAQLARARLSTLHGYLGQRAASVRQAAADSFGADCLQSQAVVLAFQQQLTLIDQIEERITALDRMIASQIDARELAWLCTIPGIGPKIARKILVLLPKDWRQWGSRRKIVRRLQAFLGFEPRRKRSGKWIGQERCSKRGNRIGRCALYQAAFAALVHDPDLRKRYDQQRARGKAHKQALINLMRIQLNRIVAILIEQRPYQPIPQ